MNKPFGKEQAENYEKWFSKGFGRVAYKLERKLIAKYFPKVSEVLDIGCGTGIWMELFKELGIRTYGLDISIDMLKFAKSKGFSNLVLGMAEKLPFKDDCFQASTFITSLEFIEDKEAALKEALRVSREYVIVAYLNRNSLLHIYRSMKATLRESIYRKATFLTYSKLLKLSRKLTVNGKSLTPVINRGTIRLSFGSFINEKLESMIPDVLPLSSFNLTIFQVKGNKFKRGNHG